MTYNLLRAALFRLDPETAHHLTLNGLRWTHRAHLTRLTVGSVPSLPRTLMGLQFPNLVGLAAGLDKNGEYLDALGALGFGFVEVGTVTPRPQPGNPRPRLFRLPVARAIINRMGFNNQGLDYLLERVQGRRYGGVLGINIGKNFDTPLERAIDDYLLGLRRVYGAADYIAVNISSPNTPGLRTLQQGDALEGLLGPLKQEQARLADRHGRYVPLAVKIAPDVTADELQLMADSLRRHRIDAVIATNTSLSRAGVEGLPAGDEAGGLSGAPLTARALEVTRQLSRMVGGELPIIAAGGIMSGADARERVDAGASLIQLYTGLIYRGPTLIREAVEALAGSPSG